MIFIFDGALSVRTSDKMRKVNLKSIDYSYQVNEIVLLVLRRNVCENLLWDIWIDLFTEKKILFQ